MKIIGTTEDLIKHLEQHRKSRLTQAEYCRNNNLSYHQFGYWRRKENKTLEIPLVPVKLADGEHTVNVLCVLKFSRGACLEIYDAKVLSVIFERFS